MKSKLKVITIVGTRPELIRLSCTIRLLDEYTSHVLVHTGQNYDYELNQVFFSDLGIREPDYFFNCDTSSLGNAVGDIIRKTEDLLLKEKPDSLLILGDTNSSLSAYMARRMHIPIFHMEAGNRCFDQNVPEETNRKIIDHISDFNLVYTEHARRNLIAEGISPRRIYKTGSPMKEVLDHYKQKIESSEILKKLKLEDKGFFLISTHREENVDNTENLTAILKVLQDLADIYRLPVVVSTHPRTKKRLASLKGYQAHPLIQFLKPFGFFDYIHLQQHAKCVISDSGTISEEAALLSFPAITIRQSMERPEAMDAGSIVLTGFEPGIVIAAIESTISAKNSCSVPLDYNISNTSNIVLNLILGLSKLSNKWWGVTSDR